MNASNSEIVGMIGRNMKIFLTNPRALSVGVIFMLNALSMSSWVAHIPAIRTDLALSEGDLGYALFGAPLGVLIMNPLTGMIINKIGFRNAIFISAAGAILSLQLPIYATSFWALVGGLILLGFCNALLNVAMNTGVTYVQKQDRVTIMSTCHGMWSLGGVIGATFASVCLYFGMSRHLHIGIIGAIMLVVFLFLWRRLGTIEEEKFESNSSLVVPTPTLWLMIFIGLAVSMGEGMAFDWSAVYLKDVAGSTASFAALAFASFATAMTLGRFTGDALIVRYGAQRLLQLGGIVAASGLALAVVFPYPYTSLAGFFLLGLGSSVGAPILYAASMRLERVPPAAGLATFASLSMIGFLAGPPVIGTIAEHVSLPFSFAVIAVLLVTGAIVARFGLTNKL